MVTESRRLSLQKPVRQTFKKARVVVSGIDELLDAEVGDFCNIFFTKPQCKIAPFRR